MSEFTCFSCKQTFEHQNDEEWNEFKAAEEFLNLYPEGKNHPTEVLCDVCNEEFREWFANLTEDEKKQNREEYEMDQC